MTSAKKKLLADGKVLAKAKRIYLPGTKVLTLSPHEHSTPKLVGAQLKKLNDTGNILVITDSAGVWVYRGGVWASKFESAQSINDEVNRPSHYTDGKIEVIDFIEDKKLGFHLGNSVKYIARAGKKDPTKTIQDLEKAKWYLDRKIKIIKSIVPEIKDPSKSVFNEPNTFEEAFQMPVNILELPKEYDFLSRKQIRDCDFSNRVIKALNNAFVYTVADLLKLSKKGIMSIPHFGKKCLTEVEDWLELKSLELQK